MLLVYAVHSVFTLLMLLVDNGRARDAIQHAEIPMPNSAALLDGRPQLIPKIIHQTWVNTSIPTHWRAPQQSCLDLHQDYEYKVSLFLALGPSSPSSLRGVPARKLLALVSCRSVSREK